MNNFAETVRNSADIVQVVSDYVSLKGSGNAFKGLCPFHSEKTPSFTVNRERQRFHCFGCGADGDALEFVKLVEKVPFPEALKIVAEKFGIPVPSDGGFGKDDKRATERKLLFEIYESASSHYCHMLATAEAQPARQVLEKRKISPEYIEKFRLGYAPSAGLAANLRIPDPVGSGLFVRNEKGEIYERFRRRLMFPIWDERGKTIAFGGRALGDVQPKYLNSAESPLYSKSNVLYALHLARNSAQKLGRLVVVEGYFDCLSLHQHGFENVVASCGTSLTKPQVDLMTRYVPEVVMNYDPDNAGQTAMRRSIDLLLGKGLRVRILKLPGGLDPDDFVRKEGAETYGRLLNSAPAFWQYLMTEAGRQFDLSKPDLKANAVQDVTQAVAKIQDRVEQHEVAREVAEWFKVPESLIFERLKLSPRRPDVKPAVHAARAQAVRRLTDSEKQLIHGLLQEPARSKELEGLLGANNALLAGVWSAPVVQQLIQDPGRNIQIILDSLGDEELRSAVGATVLEPFGRITAEQVRESVAQLYDAHLVKQEMEIRQQLQQYGSGPAPAELVRRRQEIVAEKTRIRAFKP